MNDFGKKLESTLSRLKAFKETKVNVICDPGLDLISKNIRGQHWENSEKFF